MEQEDPESRPSAATSSHATRSLTAATDKRVIPRHLAFLLTAGLVVASSWSSLILLLQLSLNDGRYGHYSHMLLIPFLSAYLIYVRQRTIFQSVTWQPRVGLPFASLGMTSSLVFSVASERDIDTFIPHLFFMVVGCWGAFIWCYGMKAFRQGMFGLVFLLGMVPLPSVMMNSIIGFLQAATAETVDVLFGIVGVPVYRQDVRFVLPNLTIEVAPECSGIRSTLSLLTCSLVAGHLFLRRPAMRIALVLVVIPLTITKNSVRIIILSLLGNYVDSRFLTESSLHNRGGIPLFFLSLVSLLAILWVLRLQESTYKERLPAFSRR